METNTLFDYDAGGSSLWRKTLERCEGKLYQEVVNEIQSCKGVKDLIVFVNEESERRSSTVSKWLEKVNYFGDHFKAYQKSIYLICSGTPYPGCLIWGYVRLVLSVGAPFDC